MRFPRRLAHLLVARVESAVANIVQHVRVEERRVLRDDPNGAPERRELQIAHVLAVDEDPARRGLVEAEEEAEDGRLAAARGPDERDFLPRRDREGDVAEDRSVGVVPEADVLERDRAATERERVRAWLVLRQCSEAKT